PPPPICLVPNANAKRLTLAPGAGLPATARPYAAALYATLHELDQRRLDWIALVLPPRTPEWDAIHDRLARAATP
ncbi:MAG TPA: Sua5 family C-terminal domain-containing protein, partial [Bryobacteraceae bacterium]|nr:Sua5 family C-terminal domain-containing protein [Bryobacteraceae bacterium]